jgi:hypothetical protein
MNERIRHIKISPEFIKNKIFKVTYNAGEETTVIKDECCDTTTSTTVNLTGTAYVYSSMTQLLSGGTNGTSLLTGLTIPFVLSENYVDIGYYSVFDGFILQKEVMNNFIFSAKTPTTYYFYNTSDQEFKKYLEFSNYMIDWGDGSPLQSFDNRAPNYYQHTYIQPSSGQIVRTISVSGMSPWGWNIVKKNVYVPFTGITIDNPNGEAFFYPMGGNWSATPISYDYIFSGDSECVLPDPYFDEYQSIPFIITGFTKSSINDLQVYGKTSTLTQGKFKPNVEINIENNIKGKFLGVIDDNVNVYTINDIMYYDYPDGTTLFVLETSGLTSQEIVCSAITKDEVLLNVIDQPQVYSNVYVERGKNSGLESTQRLGEIDNIGDLEKYGYKFFTIKKL